MHCFYKLYMLDIYKQMCIYTKCVLELCSHNFVVIVETVYEHTATGCLKLPILFTFYFDQASLHVFFLMLSNFISAV